MAVNTVSSNAVIISIVICLVVQHVRTQETIEMDCSPTIRHRFDVCPAGYCCVRDEFLATYVYCKKIGSLDDNCTTKDTESACPCGPGLYCKANIVGTFLSVYGKCAVDPNATPVSPVAA